MRTVALANGQGTAAEVWEIPEDLTRASGILWLHAGRAVWSQAIEWGQIARHSEGLEKQEAISYISKSTAYTGPNPRSLMEYP